MSAWGVCLPRGVSAQGDVSATDPSPCGQTEACENITLPQTLLIIIIIKRPTWRLTKSGEKRSLSFITARNEVRARLCFYRCVLFCSQGGEYLTRYPPTRYTTPRTKYTPRDQVHPPGPGTPPSAPGTRYTPHSPWDQVHPPGTRYTPQDQVHPPGPGTPPRPGTPPQDQVHPLGPGTPLRLIQIFLIQNFFNSNFFNSNFFNSNFFNSNFF